MQTNWSAQHSEALREYVARGMSFSAIAKALNARFETLYSRNAALGRAKRMGLSSPNPPKICLRVGPGAVAKKRRACTSRASGTLLNLLRECLWPNERRRQNSAVSNSCRAIFRFSISKRAIAVTLMAARRMEKRSRSAAIPGGRTQATARRISI